MFPTKSICTFLFSPMRAMFPSYSILPDLTTLIINVHKYKWRSSSLCIFVLSCYFIPLTSKYPSQCLIPKSSDAVRNQVSRPYKTRREIRYLYILIFTFVDSRWKNKIFRTDWYKHSPI
jgi:hypothetical protein